MLLNDGTVSIRSGGSHFTAANLLLTDFRRRKLILLKLELIGGLLHLVYLERIKSHCRFSNRATWDKLLLTQVTLVIDPVTLVTLFLDEILVIIDLFGKPQRWRFLLDLRTMTSLVYCSVLPLTVGYLLRADVNTILMFLLVAIIVDRNILVNNLSASCLHTRVVPPKHIWVSSGIPLR